MLKSGLLAKIKQKDLITSSHCGKTSAYALKLGNTVGLIENDLSLLEVSAVLHDVGKIKVPDEILFKPTTLTVDEYEVIKKHSVWGAEIVGDFFKENQIGAGTGDLAEIIRHHHERYDGGGYPDGLKGDYIPFLSQIISVADAFDAMTSDRTYRKAMDKREAAEILKNESGRQFHPSLVEAFIDLISPGTVNNILAK
ncbi:MAG: Cyclic di-GMP phosphodiesterase response regulator RpfG [Candidatus Dichloromethanomonas elyunquensis]|nr:MAG: Cyclic di-GMP phosphodiesterase response regulator RpfG [Candidatus Dichloromethanomonas elyunquensis]